MTPPSQLEDRVLHIERDMATAMERIQNLRGRVDDLTPLAKEVTILNEQVSGIVEDIRGLGKQIGAVGTMLEQRDKTASSERASVRVALIALTGTIGASVIAGVITLLAT